MCNACGLLCCASDQLRECGCDCPGTPGCWERCEWCGDTTQFGDACLCDDQENEEAGYA